MSRVGELAANTRSRHPPLVSTHTGEEENVSSFERPSPSLETVRRLQATLPGQISGDNPTNIFFFFFHPAGAAPAS